MMEKPLRYRTIADLIDCGEPESTQVVTRAVLEARVAAPTPETPSLIEAVEQFIAAAESYRCASAPIADKFVILESEMMLARNRLRALLLA